MSEARSATSLPRFAFRGVGIVVAVQVAVATAFSSRYGFHRDELYYVAAGKRPDWGYTDQPPITPLLARLATATLGDSPAGLRVVSTLAGAATVVLVALVAREVGAGRTAQGVSAAAAALSTYVVVVTHMLSTTSVDMLIWVALGLTVMRLLRTGDGRWWVAVGTIIGVGLANKWLILVLVSGLAIGVLACGPRSVLRGRWPAAGAAAALVPAAPIMVWQAVHGFPMLTVASEISQGDGPENRILFLPLQFVYLSPVLVPVWIAGIVWFWRSRWGRAFAVSYPVICVELLVLGGKPYYSLPMLLLLIPAGTEPALRWLSRGRPAVRRGLTGVAVGVGVVLSLVVGLPILPPNALNGPVLAINKELGEQYGWPEFAATVARAWREVPEGERATAVIFTADYGQASAIERYGPEYGLPAPYSGHMSYSDWGPPPDGMTGPVVLVGRNPGRFTGCRVVAVNDNGIGLKNEEQGTGVSVCSPPDGPWSRIWPTLRHFYH
ncbi:ArnT family glycosyltransferase [Amycolatopsis pigmentata]|uniref:ArnT family glycosyltransferase n=1 Tax=Amycolatopsis pigmentata TaxID=450801 RepID=A0ABW5FL72_9PSEU